MKPDLCTLSSRQRSKESNKPCRYSITNRTLPSECRLCDEGRYANESNRNRYRNDDAGKCHCQCHSHSRSSCPPVLDFGRPLTNDLEDTRTPMQEREKRRSPCLMRTVFHPDEGIRKHSHENACCDAIPFSTASREYEENRQQTSVQTVVLSCRAPPVFKGSDSARLWAEKQTGSGDVCK